MNESPAVRALLAMSFSCLRQSVGQALGGRQVVSGARRKSLLVNYQGLNVLCCKAESYQLGIPFPVTGVSGCPNQTQLANQTC